VRHGLTRTAGGGISFDVETTVKSVTIPPTIHTAMNVGGSTSSTQTFAAQSGVGTNVQTKVISVTGSATGNIVPTSVPGSPGVQQIPTSGLYAHRVRIEPYKYGWFKVEVELVDAASWS